MFKSSKFYLFVFQVKLIEERVTEARRLACQQIKEGETTKKRKRKQGNFSMEDEDDEVANMSKKLKLRKKK